MYGRNKWINCTSNMKIWINCTDLWKKIWSSIDSARLQYNLISVTLILVLDERTKLRDAL